MLSSKASAYIPLLKFVHHKLILFTGSLVTFFDLIPLWLFVKCNIIYNYLFPVIVPKLFVTKAETDWLIEDSEAEENLGFRLATSFRTAHERRLFDEPGLFADLEFWFSPMAHHREVCEQLVRACGGRIRERRPTQKMALLPTPRQVIICHEEDSHVASYLMRTKTGNRGGSTVLLTFTFHAVV